ncbi:unnamed protein product [Lota lota]
MDVAKTLSQSRSEDKTELVLDEDRELEEGDKPAPVRELVMSRVGASAAEELINTNATSGSVLRSDRLENLSVWQEEKLFIRTLCCPRPGHHLHHLHTQREPFPQPEPHSKEEERLEDETKNKEEEEEDEEKERAPLELMAEFLSSVMRRDLRLASRLCQMILVYEPENPEAIQFLPLIQQKVLEDQEKELGTDDEDDDDEDEEDDSGEDSDNSESCDEDDHSGGDEGSSHD